ncbi:PAS domain S-box protein, partial [bacterium]|nr:PAS domain S-box protein [bacterium]
NSGSESQRYPHSSRTTFRQVADNMPFAIVELDLGYNIVYANKSALETLGIDINLIESGVRLKEIIASEQFMATKEGLDRLVGGSPASPIVLRIKGRDGVEITTETFAELIVNKDVPVGVVAYSIDMTRRISIEEKIRQQEGAFRILVEQSNFVGMIVVDDQYHIEYVNDRFCAITGYTRSELLGIDFRKYLHPESIALVSEFYWKRRAGEDVPSIYDFKIIHKDGHPRDVIISSTTMKTNDGIIKTVTQMVDITEERANQQALKESEQKHRTLLEAIDSGFIIDDENGIVQSANQPICDMLGYDNPDELIGSNIISWTYGWDESDVAEKIKSRKKGKSEHYELQLI